MKNREGGVHQALEKRKGWTKLGKIGQNPTGLGSLKSGKCETSPKEVSAFGKDVVKRGHRSCCYTISVLMGPLYVGLVT